jgi:hypothetical protein
MFIRSSEKVPIVGDNGLDIGIGGDDFDQLLARRNRRAGVEQRGNFLEDHLCTDLVHRSD